MEYVQFHPTGNGLAAERAGDPGDRRECAARAASCATATASGSCSTTSRISTGVQTADNPEEGWRYTQGDKEARRPPELLTRDHVARCIVREIREGRGSPHGGVFLDIAWIREKLKDGEAHIRRKLPSMYHQFKELAGIDITKRAHGGRPDHPLRHGRCPGGRRDPDVTGPGPLRGGRVRGGAARGQPPRRQLAVGPAGLRKARRRTRRSVRQRARRRGEANGAETEQAEAAERDALAPLERQDGSGAPASAPTPGPERAPGSHAGEGRHRSQPGRTGVRARGRAGAERTRREGQRGRQPRLQPRLAHGARPADSLLLGLRGGGADRGAPPGEPRGALPGGLHPGKDDELGEDDARGPQGRRRRHGDRGRGP